MGKGIALQFKQAFPRNYELYRRACEHGAVAPGKMFVVPTNRLGNPQFIINFPTKRHWKGKSRMDDITAGLVDLVEVIRREDIPSVAIPPLGCGNGGLDWDEVRPKIVSALSVLPDVRVLLFTPEGAPAVEDMVVATARPRMNQNRAALIRMMLDYDVPGYRLTLLEIQKLAYFLQIAGQPLKLKFVKQQYGPYAEELNYVLQRMEGHFIRGYGDRSRGGIHSCSSGGRDRRLQLPCRRYCHDGSNQPRQRTNRRIRESPRHGAVEHCPLGIARRSQSHHRSGSRRHPCAQLECSQAEDVPTASRSGSPWAVSRKGLGLTEARPLWPQLHRRARGLHHLRAHGQLRYLHQVCAAV